MQAPTRTRTFRGVEYPISEAHWAAECYPWLPDAKLAAMAESIGVNGQLVEIQRRPDGKILDGRNRELACRIAGKDPVYKTVEVAEVDAYALVRGLNSDRRHSGIGPRALIAARTVIASRAAADPRANLHAVSRAEAAASQDVSVRSVASALSLLEHGVPELIALVEAESIPVNVAAAAAARFPADIQRAAVVAGEEMVRELAQSEPVAADANNPPTPVESPARADPAPVPPPESQPPRRVTPPAAKADIREESAEPVAAEEADPAPWLPGKPTSLVKLRHPLEDEKHAIKWVNRRLTALLRSGTHMGEKFLAVCLDIGGMVEFGPASFVDGKLQPGLPAFIGCKGYSAILNAVGMPGTAADGVADYRQARGIELTRAAKRAIQKRVEERAARQRQDAA